MSTLRAATVALCLCAAASAAPEPVLLDTDIGTDIDDAFALALIIRSPELKLEGVTTVSGDTRARARIAAKLLWIAGEPWRKVPVYAGEPGPAQPLEQGRWAADFSSPNLHPDGAVAFLDRALGSSPTPVTLIAVGELTNVAALLREDPAIARKIARIALMGGSVYRGYAPGSPAQPEWNIKSNPAAARLVFASGIPLLIAPLDATAMLRLDRASRERLFQAGGPLGKAIGDLYRLWGQETPTLFDPMAIALLVDASVATVKPLALEVDGSGLTRVVPDRPATCLVAVAADEPAFFRLYLGRVAPGL